MLESLFLNLGQHDSLSDEEQSLLGDLMAGERSFAAGQDIVASGSRPVYSTLLLDGLAARYKVLADGGRQ
ncbi:MAG: Crp/Fnr family transcriptional regulator, partial [Mesorhizobium sp.]